jgi:hypothetical protein
MPRESGASLSSSERRAFAGTPTRFLTAAPTTRTPAVCIVARLYAISINKCMAFWARPGHAGVLPRGTSPRNRVRGPRRCSDAWRSGAAPAIRVKREQMHLTASELRLERATVLPTAVKCNELNRQLPEHRSATRTSQRTNYSEHRNRGHIREEASPYEDEHRPPHQSAEEQSDAPMCTILP